MKKKIPAPRGEPYKFLGIRPDQKDLEWITENVGLDEFRAEIDRTIAALPKKHMIRIWVTELDEKDVFRKKLRSRIYGLLKSRIPDHRFNELITDVHEFQKDTLLAVLDSHVRYFFVLIPEISEDILEYDRIISRLESRNTALATILSDYFKWPPGVQNAGVIIIQETLNRLRVEKGETDE